MNSWEYLVLEGFFDKRKREWLYQGFLKEGEGLEFDDQEQMANELGQMGWELTSVVGHIGPELPAQGDRLLPSTTAYYFYFKRPAQNSNSKSNAKKPARAAAASTAPGETA